MKEFILQNNMVKRISYSDALREGFVYLLNNYPEVFIIGQGLWSPWYVGNTMKDLDKIYGKERIIDTPVSESACTGAGVGASLVGMKPIVIHPRMDFMLYAIDPIVNQAAKWSHMFGGQVSAGLTIRAIINRGGEQGAQHSQALHSWFSHIPGLRVVMPYTVQDARDLLISSVISSDPVIFIDDRWLYDMEDEIDTYKNIILSKEGPRYVSKGSDISIVASGHTTRIAKESRDELLKENISCEVIDLRILNPLNVDLIIESINKTKNLLVLDGGWAPCGISAEIIAKVCENIDLNILKSKPCRITLPDAPAPTSFKLEKDYYFDKNKIITHIHKQLSIK